MCRQNDDVAGFADVADADVAVLVPDANAANAAAVAAVADGTTGFKHAATDNVGDHARAVCDGRTEGTACPDDGSVGSGWHQAQVGLC